MPVHDWTRVSAGTFHAFHVAWIAEIQRALNGGVLPEGYYALAEQVAGHVIPDVLTLQEMGGNGGTHPANPWPQGVSEGDTSLAVADAPPQTALSDTIDEAMLLAARRRRLAIHHATDDRLVALLEIVSPGNKHKRGAVEVFVDKAVAALNDDLHLMVIDLFPPGPHDPQGMHGAIWARMGGRYEPPAGEPLTLVAYRVSGPVTAYIEPLAVSRELPSMPLFLDPDHYVQTPLATTYREAYAGVPRRWQRVIEG